MKKTIFITTTLLILFSACNKYKEYPEFLTGEWVCQEWRTADNSSYLLHPTDSTFIIRFGQHNQQTYCSGIREEYISKWMENPQFNYQLEDNILTISGKDENGNSIKGELEIKVLTDSKLIYHVTSLHINNSNQKAGGDYVLYRTGHSFKAQLINSTWSGLSDDETPVTYTFADQIFELTYGNPPQSSHLAGNYFVYGNLLVLNYTSAPFHYECWQLSNVNSKLNFEKWVPLNDDGSAHLKKRKFSLSKSS